MSKWVKGKLFMTDEELRGRIIKLKDFVWCKAITADDHSDYEEMFFESYDALERALIIICEKKTLENRLKHLLQSEAVRMYDEKDPKNPSSYTRDIAELDHLVFDSMREEKTAHWDINIDGYYPFCSHCGEAVERMSPHCPNCGAKMTTRRHGE